MPLSLNQRNPGMVERVQDAYAETQAAGDAAQELGSMGLGAVLADDLGHVKPDTLKENPDASKAFETRLNQIKPLYERIGLTAPNAQKLHEGGIDLDHLGERFQQMSDENLEPELVVAPILNADTWKSLFMDMRDDMAINYDKRIEDRGLYISKQILDSWEAVSKYPHSTPIAYTSAGNHGVYWSVRLISAYQLPMDQTEYGPYNEGLDGYYPTLHEYLGLQAVRLQSREPLFSPGSKVWLSGIFDNDSERCAGFGAWNANPGEATGELKIGWSFTDKSYGLSGYGEERLARW